MNEKDAISSEQLDARIAYYADSEHEFDIQVCNAMRELRDLRANHAQFVEWAMPQVTRDGIQVLQLEKAKRAISHILSHVDVAARTISYCPSALDELRECFPSEASTTLGPTV